jgi:hypothetical protein
MFSLLSRNCWIFALRGAGAILLGILFIISAFRLCSMQPEPRGQFADA